VPGVPSRTACYSVWQQVIQCAVGNSENLPKMPAISASATNLRTLQQALSQLTLLDNQDFSGVQALYQSGALTAGLTDAINAIATVTNDILSKDRQSDRDRIATPGRTKGARP